ncbi:MAG: hypothetical protein CFE45_20960 [Burkholderiales bacterium PBB5]|nr:MAG: hypothetical protein CFE45_20960 [Burkholderiales bacterium PBB5]
MAKAGLTALLLAGIAMPVVQAADGIYTCVDAQGRKLTSDRPIPDCVTREQRLLNKDGSVRGVLPPTELRLSELARERKPLLEEAEFYKGRQLPARLKQQLDANDAGVDAQRSATANQQAELVRINKLYDDELDRLRRLWAGAVPGSLGATVPATELTAAPPALRNASQ